MCPELNQHMQKSNKNGLNEILSLITNAPSLHLFQKYFARLKNYFYNFICIQCKDYWKTTQC